MALATWLSIGGLGLDFAGAAFLAYDVLYGPHARLQASNRRTRLAIARENQERYERSIRESSESRDTANACDTGQLHQELAALNQLIGETTAELKHWEWHEHRAHLNALLGLLLLMGGFGCQAVGALLGGPIK